MSDGILVVISSPSGGGKSTLGARLLKSTRKIKYSVSITTRPPRKGEIDGVDYCFVDKQEFFKKRDSNDLIEYANVHGAWYGTPKSFIRSNLKKGQDILLDIDVQGGKQIKKIFPEAVLIFIAPPSLAVLEARLRGRHQDNELTIRNRLKAAKNEYAQAKYYDYLVVNEKISKAASQLKSIITAERCRITRNLQRDFK